MKAATTAFANASSPRPVWMNDKLISSALLALLHVEARPALMRTSWVAWAAFFAATLDCKACGMTGANLARSQPSTPTQARLLTVSTQGAANCWKPRLYPGLALGVTLQPVWFAVSTCVGHLRMTGWNTILKRVTGHGSARGILLPTSVR